MKPRFLLLALLSPLFVPAQERPWNNIEFYPPSAASLIRALDCPPAHYTGSPEISVPLYTVESSEIAVPLSLSFDINYYRMANSAPATIGVGWSLNAEPIITRVINGTDDMTSNYKSNPNFLRSYRNAGSTNLAMYQIGILDGRYDTEPDKFYYRLLDKSGHFYFTPDGDIVPVPYNGIKIERSGSNFTITDTDGTAYTFDVHDKTFNQLNYPVNTTFTSAWHCSKITSVSGKDCITFKYYTLRKYKPIGSHPYVEVYDRTANYPTEQQGTYFVTATESQIAKGNVDFERLAGPKIRNVQYSSNYRYYLRKDGQWRNIGGTEESSTARSDIEITPAILTEIEWKGGKVKLNYDQTYEYMTSVTVSSTASKTVSDIRFTQSGTSAKRTLTKVKINNDEYGFAYPNQPNFPYGKGINDYWDSEAYSLLTELGPIPSQKISIDVGYQYAAEGRTTDDNRMRDADIGNVSVAHILTRYSNETPTNYFTISYPNGGKTEYYMEHHKYGSYSTGGMRLAMIRYLDNQTVKRIRKYEYDRARADVLPAYEDSNRANNYTEQEITYCSKSMMTAEVVGKARKRTFYPHATGLASFSGSSPVVYGSVTEYDIDPASDAKQKILSKKVYSFDTGAYKLSGSTSIPYPIQPVSLSEGQLQGTKEYRCENDSTFTLVRSVDYTYSKFVKESQKIYQIKLWATKYPVEISGLTLDDTYRHENTTITEDSGYIPIGCSRMTREVENVYADDGSVLSRVSDYYYDNATTYHMPTRVETTASNGDKIVKYTLRPGDYTSNESTFATLKAKNIIDIPVECVTVRNGSIADGELYKYDDNGSVIEAYRHEPEVQDTRSPIQYPYTKPGYAYSATPRYMQYCMMEYDVNNRLCYVRPYNLPFTYYLWGYNGLYLVASIVNGSESIIDLKLGKGFTSGITSSATFTATQKQSIDNLRNTYTDWQITTAIYEPLIGIKTLTDPSGHSTTYEYHTTTGNTGKLRYIRDSKGNAMTEYEYSNE